ncbi:hypothetical protein TrLO_g12399 [Triparma laevis f. longispina]|uniref:Uncharacterized protein n=1 Tax=Triparma laevis f. longispina TaxID=1714387 RepID=A0A9W7FRD2_9STRA|nr:hypothetical protein TrLO_g12399 [Triparma laevis f. longispina]
MFKSISNWYSSRLTAPETGRKRGGEDEEKQDGEGIIMTSSAVTSSTLTTVFTVPATTDQFMFTPECRRHFVKFVPGDTLMTLRLETKGSKAVADAFIDEGVKSGVIIVHKDILEGFEKIDGHAFMDCTSLTTVSFLTTLTLIGWCTFDGCESLDNADLFHTNLQELDDYAFSSCSELKSMTIPDSLQTLGSQVFCDCSKLVPSNIDIRSFSHDATSRVIAHLRSIQQQP